MPPDKNNHSDFDYCQLEPKIAIAVKTHAEQIQEKFLDIALHIIEVGGILLEVHHLIGRGFNQWVQSEFSWSRATAYRYIGVYQAFNKCLTVRHFDDVKLSARVLYKLSSPSVPEELREKVVERAIAGQSITEPVVDELLKDEGVRKDGGSKSKGEIQPSEVDINQTPPAGHKAIVLDENNPYFKKTVQIVDGFRFEDDMMVFFRGANGSADLPCLLSMMQLVDENSVLDAEIVADADAAIPPGKTRAPSESIHEQDVFDQVHALRQVLKAIIEHAREHIPEKLLNTAEKLLGGT